MSGTGDSGERRRRLFGIKLRTLIAVHLATDVVADPEPFGAGSAMVVDGEAWVIVDGPAGRRLGAAMAWAIRHDARALHVITEVDGGVLARRAHGFSFPISIWFPEARLLLPVVAEQRPSVPSVRDEHLAFIPMIAEAGAVPHVEHGVVTGEVRGLEVCRVVDEPTVGNFSEPSDVVPDPSRIPDRSAPLERPTDLGVTLEVGVGANDREAFRLLHGHIPTVEALTGVVEAVSSRRSVAARQHPLNRMAPERFLRWQVEQDPGPLGLDELEPAEPPVLRQSMKYTEPCVGRGTDGDGRPVAVVFSSGVDLDLAPFVADAVLDLDDDTRVIVAVPERDLVAITNDLVSLLRHPVELVGLTSS